LYLDAADPGNKFLDLPVERFQPRILHHLGDPILLPKVLIFLCVLCLHPAFYECTARVQGAISAVECFFSV
jgi:hypothetical protein